MVEKVTIELVDIPTVCSLDNLAQPENRERCFEALQSAERVHSLPKGGKRNSFYFSNEREEALRILISDSIKSLKVIWKSKEEFDDECRKIGMISALFSSTHPKILELLSLPEIDPEFISELSLSVERYSEKEIKELTQTSDSFIQGGE